MAAVVAYYRDVSTVMEAQRKAAPPFARLGAGLGTQVQAQPTVVDPASTKPRFPKRGQGTPKAKAAADADS